MTTLPEDVLRHIFSYVAHPTLLNCRLANHAVGLLATASAFRHVRLEATRSPLPFVRIAESPELRYLVREVTVDATHPELDHVEQHESGHLFYQQFLLALPRMRFFSNMRVLNLRFLDRLDFAASGSRRTVFWIPPPPRAPGLGAPLDASEGLLTVALQCLAGEWTQERQREWEALLNFTWLMYEAGPEFSISSRAGMAEFLVPSAGFSLESPICLSQLTISNLHDILEDGFYASSAFKSLFFVQPPPALKLLIAPRQHDNEPSEDIFQPDMYDFFEKLPTTWLAPPLASNLRELSLYCCDYFGWAPKLDMRMINLAGPGPVSSAFPNLRVLALGNYVFSHQWQVDWIASLGRDNGRGGLEELYLDNSPIMWRAYVPGPLDDSVVDLGGGEKLDNQGYPVKEVMTRQSPHDTLWDPVRVDFDLRWCTVLRTWQKMSSLKVFRMGGGDWGGNSIWRSMMANATTEDVADEEEALLWARRQEGTVHLNYDQPSANEWLEHDPNSRVRRSIGLDQDREYLLQYVNFNVSVGPTPWVDKDFMKDMMDQDDDGWQRYGESRASDEKALRELMETVASRTKS